MKAKALISKQRAFFLKGDTLSYEYRKDALERLYKSIQTHESDILKALKRDLGKPSIEGFFAEVGQVYKELTFIKKRLKSYMKVKRVKSELSDFPSKSFITPHPYGVVLVISPWNYPFLLAIGPVIGAIAAGNTVILKPSEYSVHTTKVIEKIMDVFDDDYVKVVKGAVQETTELLNEKLDYIFFTGSTAVGKIIMEKASKHLTPVSLELGGKSPVIIDKDTKIDLAAKRIAFGKLLNAGQTCIAPDYVLVHESVKVGFLNAYKEAVESLYGKTPLTSKDYCKIINKKHFDRLKGLLNDGNIVYGGEVDDSKHQIAPTVLTNVNEHDSVMKDEIFGPILPVLEYQTLDEVIQFVNDRNRPLALYLFTENKQTEKQILSSCQFGGGCINDTIVQVGSSYLPFGGVGESGLGSYHGEASFKTFTHYRSVVKKSTKFDFALRYAPYSKKTEKLLRRFLK